MYDDETWDKMMGSSLLANLGFSDIDKAEPLHDLACQYIASNAQRFINCVSESYNQWNYVNHHFEVILTKGSGDYKTTIGFIDLRVIADRPLAKEEIYINVEVKVHKIQIGNILRQIALYKAYDIVKRSIWYVATTYKLTQNELDMLSQSDIRHIYLGEAFESWCGKKKQDAKMQEL